MLTNKKTTRQSCLLISVAFPVIASAKSPITTRGGEISRASKSGGGKWRSR